MPSRNLPSQITDVQEQSKGIIEFSLSSEEPYERWFGTEILKHQKDSVNLERINGGNASFLFNHDRDRYIGILNKGWLHDSKLRVRAKFELDNEFNQIAKQIYTSVLN